MSFAKVAVNLPAYSVDRFFDYAIPKGMNIAPGMRVIVPFSGRSVEGFVADVTNKSDVEKLSEIAEVRDASPILSEKEIRIACAIRYRYFCTYYSAFRLFFPPGASVKFKEAVKLSDLPENDAFKATEHSSVQRSVLEFLLQNEGVSTVTELNTELGKNVRQSVLSMEKKGLVTIEKRRFSYVREKWVNTAFISADFEDVDAYICEFSKKAPVQIRLLEILISEGEMAVPELLDCGEAGRGSLDALIKRGIVEIYKKPVSRIEPVLFEHTKAPHLTEGQSLAVQRLKDAKGRHILRGVTGSGKTEVYLRLIKDTIDSGKTALMLVPEIGLTPQTVNRFQSRFGDRLAVLHSGLSLGERYDNWEKIRRGEADVVVGARSAVFAPVKNIGIIIIDEQHDSSYTSENSPRYDAREVAYMRAKADDALLLEASATPRISDVYLCKNRISMRERVNKGNLPQVEIVDMRAELEGGNTSVFSEKLAFEISKNLHNREQTILFVNRRGHSSFVSCRSCGYVFTCPNCSVSLKYHLSSDKMMCHYCGYMEKPQTVCPSCASKYVKFFGIGTQKVEEEISRLFPTASVIRMDNDTTAKKSAHKKLLDRFEKERADILLGTQMVTKGLDFPNVSLVGVLAADVMLSGGEYDSTERAFSQLTQVFGRAGRGDIPGRAVIQTYSPDSEVIDMASQQDYNNFYAQEIAMRKALIYPPFCRMFTLVVTGEDNTECGKRINEIKEELKHTEGITALMRPTPCVVSKINNMYRWQMIVKASEDIRTSLWRVYDNHHKKRRSTYLTII